MLEFWHNPELVRHARAELRASRMVTVGAVVAIVCTLIALMCWSSTDWHSLTRVQDFFHLYYRWIVILQAVLLWLWTLSSCIQSIARERELKTYDFLKTTRLTPGEVIVGKLLGVPIMAYFIVACSLPIAFVAGIAGGYAITAILLTYLVLFAFALFLGLGGLWISMQMDKPQPGIGIVGLLFVVYLTLFVGMAIGSTPFSGFAALSPLPALGSLYPRDMDFGGRMSAPTVFGYAVPWIVLSLVLYVLFGFWLALMLRRNLKKDTDEVCMLSPWQALGFSVFLNVLLYAFFNPAGYMRFDGSSNNQEWMHRQIYELMTLLVVINGAIIFWAGISTLTPHERLKVWWRKRKTGHASFLAEDGLSWPWLLMAAAIGYIFLLAYRWGSATVSTDWNLKSAALLLSSLAIFAIRDVLFLQWCCLTRMKRPVQKGFLFLLLYYFAAAVIAGVAATASTDAGYLALGLLTPLAQLDSGMLTSAHSMLPVEFLGMALQIGAILLVYLAIAVRLNRAPRVATAEAA